MGVLGQVHVLHKQCFLSAGRCGQRQGKRHRLRIRSSQPSGRSVYSVEVVLNLRHGKCSTSGGIKDAYRFPLEARLRGQL